MCPPDMCPVAKTKIMSAKPMASGAKSPELLMAAMIAKTNKNVAMASATAFRTDIAYLFSEHGNNRAHFIPGGNVKQGGWVTRPKTNAPSLQMVYRHVSS